MPAFDGQTDRIAVAKTALSIVIHACTRKMAINDVLPLTAARRNALLI